MYQPNKQQVAKRSRKIEKLEKRDPKAHVPAFKHNIYIKIKRNTYQFTVPKRNQVKTLQRRQQEPLQGEMQCYTYIGWTSKT